MPKILEFRNLKICHVKIFFEHLGDLRLTQVLSRHRSSLTTAVAKWFSSASGHGTAFVVVSSWSSISPWHSIRRVFFMAWFASCLYGTGYLRGTKSRFSDLGIISRLFIEWCFFMVQLPRSSW